MNCPNCGKDESHFVPPSFGEPGFFICSNGDPPEHIVLAQAKALCENFINKVETGRAHSIETYADCQELLKNINALEVI
jgi:hypothetical protein